MAKKILTLNIGASAVALAEYEVGSGGAMTLANYGIAPLAAPVDSGNAEAILVPALGEIVRTKGIKPGKVAVSVSGQMAFLRPAAIAMAGGEDKFEQMVRYEIEQNIPFPLDEMVCDRQILGDTENGDKAVLIVAAKIEQIESITDAVAAAGFTPEYVDVAPVALVNALRSTAGDDGSAVILLDIGAKTSTLVITEGEKFYNRSIPVAGNTITKDIAQALGCTLEEAEKIKLERAYVSMGGVMEDDDPVLDKISKVCRTVLTRLNAEISRSVNFYRSQQSGSAPSKLYVTGGTALLPQLDEFFASSLGIEVEAFNPFGMIALAPSLSEEAMQTDAAFLSATAGLAARVADIAPVSINLLPPSLVSERAEKKKIPVVAFGAAALVAGAVCALVAVNHSVNVVDTCNESIESVVNGLKKIEGEIKTAREAETRQEAEAAAMRDLLMRRTHTVACLAVVRQAIGDSLWIEKWEPGKITIRGWKDRIDEFVAKAAAKGATAKTAPELVVARLKAAGKIINPESVRVTDMSTLGKDASIEQFAVELEFK